MPIDRIATILLFITIFKFYGIICKVCKKNSGINNIEYSFFSTNKNSQVNIQLFGMCACVNYKIFIFMIKYSQNNENIQIQKEILRIFFGIFV